MRDSIGTEVSDYIQSQTVVGQATILGPDEESVSRVEVRAAAIDGASPTFELA